MRAIINYCSNATEQPNEQLYQLLAVMQLKQPNGQLNVTVDHSQLWPMAWRLYYTIDRIAWPLPPTLYRALPPNRHLHVENALLNQQCTKRDAIYGFMNTSHSIAYWGTIIYFSYSPIIFIVLPYYYY